MPLEMVVPFLAITLATMMDLDALGQDFQFTDPGPNKVVWVDSPNFNERPEGVKIDTIVLHHTAGSTLAGTVKWFTMPEAQVSAHFTIGKDGSIVQMVSNYNRAWHAGASKDSKDRDNVNNFSIGIEIVNKGDGPETYPPAQVKAVELLCRVLIDWFPIRQITSHEYIAEPQGRKNDPINYPWESLENVGVPLIYGRKPAKPSSEG
ncbi:MAG: N-acetylmuramoyl-L-alanine amidase [Fimbriimonadaceae bacterium]|nr:MAG: N-acetylmuramoyl-L-alanine amidase [Fimbriimonadaceae bacterium]